MEKIKTETEAEVSNTLRVAVRSGDSKDKQSKEKHMDVLSSICSKRLEFVQLSGQNTTNKSDRDTDVSTSSINRKSELNPPTTKTTKIFDIGSDEYICIKNKMGTHKETEVKTVKRSVPPKPQLSYIALISDAIQSSRTKKMLLSDIYEWIVNNFPFFKMANRSWRNSVRHNLSVNECFIKRDRCDSGKGHYWGIHAANQEDFAKGDYRRRHARRLVKKCNELTQLFETDFANDVTQKSSNPMTSQNGYAVMTCTTVSNNYLIKMFGAAVLSTMAN